MRGGYDSNFNVFSDDVRQPGSNDCFIPRYIEVFRSSMLEASRAQMGGGGGGGYGRGGGAPPRGGGGRDFGGYGGGGGGMRGGRPSPYDRMSGGPPLGRGYGAYGPSSRGSRPMKSKFVYMLHSISPFSCS